MIVRISILVVAPMLDGAVLSAFPAPPTHIPLGPNLLALSPNPPPSRPPPQPLPPIPVPQNRGLAGRGGRQRRSSSPDIASMLEDSGEDACLDLHTPLPSLMLRHGLLSPHSRLLRGEGRDERDNRVRKERHRDGETLREGVGLTTGLGWSDSEDEDAPSPLTRRLSSLNLSRRHRVSATTNSDDTLSSPSSSLSDPRLQPSISRIRPMYLTRRHVSATADRPPVPIPSPASLLPYKSLPSSPIINHTPRPKPRTGTGMLYRRSTSHQPRQDHLLTPRAVSAGLAIRPKLKAPPSLVINSVTDHSTHTSTSTTPIGRAF